MPQAKGILPDLLVSEMRAAFGRSEEFLDLEKGLNKMEERQKAIPTEKLGNLTREELAMLQKLLEKMNAKTSKDRIGGS